MPSNGPRTLLLDIETSPTIAYVWNLFDERIGIDQIVQPGETISWAAKWLGDAKVAHMNKPTAGKVQMLKGIYNLLDEADIVVHWNGVAFDIPTLNKEFIKQGWAAPAPFHEVDLLHLARKKFKFQSNKFDFILRELGLPGKIKTDFELWRDFMAGDKKAIKQMKAYNIHDAKMLEPVYMKLRSWTNSMPAHSLFTGNFDCCPVCGSKHIQRRGYHYITLSAFQRYHCKDCGKWWRGSKALKKVRYT